MQYQPDLVVVSPTERRTYLIVEVGSGASDLPARQALTRQMIRQNVPTGLLVTPRFVTVFRDSFRGDSPDAVEPVGQFPTSDIGPLQLFASGKGGDARAFEEAVRRWLVDLKGRLDGGYLAAGDLKPVIRDHILPALEVGEIRAAGPRISERLAR